MKINHMIDSEGNPLKPGLYTQRNNTLPPTLYYIFEENGELRGKRMQLLNGPNAIVYDKLTPVSQWHFSGLSGFYHFEPLSQERKEKLEDYAKSLIEFINQK